MKTSIESLNRLNLKLAFCEREIDGLTCRIAEHRKSLDIYAISGYGMNKQYKTNQKSINEWRRVSIALHLQRAELKNIRDCLIAQAALPASRAQVSGESISDAA